MLISSTEPFKDFTPLGIVNQYHSQAYNMQIFRRDLNVDETVAELIKLLVSKAERLGADGIFKITINIFPAPGAMASHFNYNIYGTAVKFT